MGNPVFHSQYTAAQIEASLGKTPTVNYTTRTWLIWDIETSQYVDSGVSVDTNIMIDDTLSIPDAAADAAAVGRRFSDILDPDELFPAIEQGGLNVVDGQIVERTNAKRVRLANPLSDGIYEISCDDGYFYLLCAEDASAAYGGNGTFGPCTVSYDSTKQFSVAIGRTDNADISVDEGRHLHIRKLTDIGTPAEIKIGGVVRLTDLNAPTVNYSYNNSAVFKIPAGGFSVSIPFEAVVANRKYWYATFYKMVNGRLETNPDYSYGYMVDGKTAATAITVYYPYEANTYAQVSTMDAANTTISAYDRQDGGRLLTLAPLAIKGVYNRDVTPPVLTQYLPSFKIYALSGNYTPPQMLYGTVIRMKDADSISCAPRYSLCAWFYNDEGTLVDSIYGSAYPSFAVGGPTYIDFKSRNAAYAIIGIRCPEVSSGTASTDKSTETMGILAREDDVLKCVYVKWKPTTVVTHRNELPWVVAENIKWLKSFTFPQILQHHYRGPWTAKQTVFHAAEDATIGFYAGHNTANSLLNMVTMESYGTALKSLYTRAYAGEWLPYDEVGGVVQQPEGVIGRGYGWICSNLPHALSGFKGFSTSSGYYKIPNYNGSEIIKNFDLRSCTQLLRPGDWLWGQLLKQDSQTGKYRYDYHVMLVTDIVSINGIPYAVEFLESYPPMVRRRFLCLDPMLSGVTDEFGTEDDFAYYNLVSRPNPRDLRLITDTWDTSISDWTPGVLACDRGHNSVYCAGEVVVDGNTVPIGDVHCYITIFDDDVETISIAKDGSEVETVTIGNNYINLYESPYRTIDIIDILRDHGPGDYDICANNAVQDSFLVAEMPSIDIEWPAAQTANEEAQEVLVNTGCVRNADGKAIDPVTGYEVVCVIGTYKPQRDEDYPTSDGSENVEYVYNPETGEWDIVVKPGGGITPAGSEASALRFSLSVRAEDLVDTGSGLTANFAYTTKFAVTDDQEADFYFNWVDVMYVTPNGGFVMGQDLTTRWYDSDARMDYRVPIPSPNENA